MMKKITCFCGAILALPVFTFAETIITPAEPVLTREISAPAGLEVAAAGLGTGVENHTLVGEATAFDTSVSQIYCLTKIQAASTPTAIKHVWSVDGKVAAEVPLSIKGSPWRTYSRKTVWPGAWKVEVQDEAGAVLKVLDFSVTQAAPL
jgi:hypothetical protein